MKFTYYDDLGLRPQRALRKDYGVKPGVAVKGWFRWEQLYGSGHRFDVDKHEQTPRPSERQST